MSALGTTAAVAAGITVLAWLVVSFAAPGPRRVVVEWIATLGLYATLLAFFLNLSRAAWLEERTVALVAFGFLAGIFAAGGVLSLYRLVQVIRGRVASGASATN